MAAEALEQSVLESKDKDQLLAIAKALGVKASARTKKSDIIDQILESTGSPARVVAETPTASPADGGSDVSSNGQASNGDAAAAVGDGGTAAGAVSGDPAPGDGPATLDLSGPPLDVDMDIDEPPAAGERAVGADGDDATDGAGDGPAGAAPGPTSTPSVDAEGSARSQPGPAAGQPGQTAQYGQSGQYGQGARPVERGVGGGQPQSANGSGPNGAGQQGAGLTDGQPGEDGESRNRRRRRRRKGGARGPDGPQGDDGVVVDEVMTTAVTAPPEAATGEQVEVEGYLDMRDEGYGFLRVRGYLPSRDDSYIPVKLARQYGLRKGDHITGLSRPAGRNEKNPALLDVLTVNGGDPEAARRRPRFEDLTALFPDERLRLEDPADPTNMVARIIDLVSPIGKGQRGIIVSPPKAGKTTVMKQIAKSIEVNNPEVKLIVLLIDERPEEVTDIRRTVKGEVISSTFDRPSDEHTHVAELAIEKAKRLVEQGEDVVVILDGITRLSRAYNLAAPASGRILSGGIDAGALYPPKKFFGAARNVEEGGSLTILATALVDTNSRMDEAIFEEFKGTGNMELRLDRRLAERRIYPAIDVDASSTRHEELLFDRKQLQMVWKLRRVLSGLAADGNAAPGLELLIDRLKTFRTNDEFLNEIAKQPSM
ncbi:MAG: transcription termination factor Rho [Ilumatobacteraceae bacterium]